MRVRVRTLAALYCAALLTGCGGSGGQGAAHPAGWTAQGEGVKLVWIDPRDPAERYTVNRPGDGSGSLSDLASAVTTDALLQHKGAKLVNAEPFPGCPGEAGWQTFDVPARGGSEVLRVGFSQWSGAAVVVQYERPARLPDAPEAIEAMRRSICSS